MNSHSEIVRQPLDAQKCTLLVIDIQEKLVPAIHERERLVRNSQLLIRLANILSVPVIVTTQYVKGLGQIVPEIASLVSGVQAIDKLEFGCFGSAEFCSHLNQFRGRSTLLLCGMETHICVLQTALGALNQGYLVHVAGDAVSSRTELNWKIGLERMRDAGAVISSAEMLIYELLGKSGSTQFKEMLKYLR